MLFPLHGAIMLVMLAITALTIAALVGVLLQPSAGFVAAGKQTKLVWIGLLVVGSFVTVIGLVAAIVYFVDVRPAVAAASAGPGGQQRSSSDGPYGPSRR
jgi:hypothetical protein